MNGPRAGVLGAGGVFTRGDREEQHGDEEGAKAGGYSYHRVEIVEDSLWTQGRLHRAVLQNA